jgi:hypothetical protein
MPCKEMNALAPAIDDLFADPNFAAEAVLPRATSLLRQLEGFALTTAEILYRLPDYPRLLQGYMWQDYDLALNFPKLVDHTLAKASLPSTRGNLK